MKLRNKLLLLGLAFLAFLAGLFIYGFFKLQSFSKNEDPTFWAPSIAAIEARYDVSPPKDVIVFVGSSSIRKWKTLSEDMAPYPSVNHGFGGSKIEDVTHYIDRLVTPFHPKAVVLFVGTNDINGVSGNSKTAEDVYARTVELFNTLQERLPDTPIYYISISPTKARWKVWSEASKANRLISQYTSNYEKITFIDTTDELLNEQGEPNSELFIWDGLHLNAEGYAVWSSIVYPILQADLR